MCDPERQRIINEAARILAEIRQIFTDTEYWNDHTRPKRYPNDPPINPDPDGTLKDIEAGLVAALRCEAERGNFPQTLKR
ncbi:MAG: hypothetical protein AB7T38_02550 [Nitrospirales bacterium]